MQTHHDPPTITCFPSSFRTIDAIPAEAFRDSGGGVYLMNADGTIAAHELETMVKVFWNSASLFVVFHGKFNELRLAHSAPVESKTGKTFTLWEQSDVYEVFIGTDVRRSRTYKEFQVAPDSRRLDIDVENIGGVVKGDFDWVSGFRCRSIVDRIQKTWDSALEIPWKAFGANFETQSEWDVNFCRATGKFHGDELFSWSPVGVGEKVFHQPEKFGRMVIQR